MNSLIENMIFPAPQQSYNENDLAGKLIYIPKFSDLYHEKDEEKKEQSL